MRRQEGRAYRKRLRDRGQDPFGASVFVHVSIYSRLMLLLFVPEEVVSEIGCDGKIMCDVVLLQRIVYSRL